MLNCPDKSLKAWKDLVEVIGEDTAYAVWNEYDGAVPQMYYTKGSSKTDELKLKAIDNAIHEQYLTILDSKEYKEQMLQPNTDENIKKICNEMKEANTEEGKTRMIDILGVLYHIANKQGSQLGKNVLGQAALHATDHIEAQKAQIMLTEQRPNFEGIDKIQEEENTTTLATFRDIEGNRISDTISEMINALVDVLKEPYIKYSGITEHNAATFFYMLRTGLTLKQVVHFFNHPLIRYYNKEIAKRQFNSSVYNSTLHKNLINELLNKYKGDNTIVTLDNNTLEQKTKFYSNSIEDSFDYSVVKEFDRLFNAASKVNELMRVSKYDTAGVGTSFGETRGMEHDFKKFEENNNIGQGKEYIMNWQNKFERNGVKTTLGAYKEIVEESVSYFDSLYTSNSYSEFQANLDNILKKALGKNRVVLYSKYVSDFATYITQNYGDFPSSLIKNSKSTSTVANRIKSILTSDNKKLKNNLFLNSLILDTSGEQHKIMLQSGVIGDTYKSDAMSTSFEELAYLDGNLARDIVKVGILQDGFNRSPYSFLQLVPISFKLEHAESFYNVLSGINMKDFDTKFKINNFRKALNQYYPPVGREFNQPDNTFFVGKKSANGKRAITIVANNKTYVINAEGLIKDKEEDVIIGRSSLDYRSSVLGKVVKTSPTAEEFRNSFESNIERIKKEQCQ